MTDRRKLTLAFGIAFFLACAKEKPQTHSEILGPPLLDTTADQLQNTEFTAYLDYPITPDKNLIWCATMQLAWNEMLDVCGGVQPSGPAIVSELNRKIVTRSDLDDSSYVAMAGEIEERIVKRIREELDTKFSGQAPPELLEGLPPQGLVAFSYLFKDLAFQKHFLRMKAPFDFMGSHTETFGFHNARNKEEQLAAEQVMIHDYLNADDFVIEIKSQSSGDRLILAKMSPDSTLHQTIAQVARRLRTSPTPPDRETRMQIPVLDFRLKKNYNELLGIDICGVPVVRATQLVRFKLDEAGAKLKSEAVIVMSSLDSVEPPPIPQLIFDKPFLVVLERQGMPHPYFALWVDNPELLVPFVPEKAER